MNIQRVDAPRCKGGEQPIWDTAEQAIYYIDNVGQKIHRYDPGSATSRTWEMPTVITSFALREAGGAIVTLRSGIQNLNLEDGSLELVHPLPGPPFCMFNDAKADLRGRWLIGASTSRMSDPLPDGGLYVLDHDSRLERLDGGIHVSNGPCFSPDNSAFYFADSWTKTFYAYDYDLDTGSIANRRALFNTEDLGGLPDGATVDRDGLIWVTIYGGSKLAVFRPNGVLERVIEVPTRYVSSISFGGANLDVIYLTTIRNDSPGEPEEDAAGYLYAIEGAGAVGMPERRYGS